VEYLKKLGMESIRKHEIGLTEYALEKFSEIDAEVYGPLDAVERCGLVSFNMPGIHPHDVAAILDTEYSVAIRSGHHCAQPLIEHLGEHSSNRASFYVYNTEEEVDA
jgi:cysteine desulfurase/selenocysteine lyase